MLLKTISRIMSCFLFSVDSSDIILKETSFLAKELLQMLHFSPEWALMDTFSLMNIRTDITI